MMEKYVDILGGLTIPDSKNAEYQVLADIISTPEYIPRATEMLNAGMFSQKECRTAWEVVCKMYASGEAIDLVTVGTKIDKNVVIEMTGSRFNMGMCSETSVYSHCRALCELSLRRKIFTKSLEMLKASTDNVADITELAGMPGKLVEAITSDTRSDRSTKDLRVVMNELANTIQNNQVEAMNGERSRVPTGFELLDRLTYSGFNAGNLIILSGRPSVGKTAIMLQMVKTASTAGFPVSVYSLEMTRQELGQRLLFSTGIVMPRHLIGNNVDWDRFETANGQIDGLPIFINDTVKTLEEITTDIVIGHQQGRCKIAFIDYLGLIATANTSRPLYQAISEITARLKRLAKECRIPIVLLCQLNRDKAKEGRKPELFDLRDSGSIEQDADICLMADRESPDLNDHNVEIWVRKNRQGQAGNICIKLTANETFTKFEPRE